MTRLERLMIYLDDAPDDAFLLFAIAKEYEGMGDKTNALLYYEKLVTEHKDYVGTYYHLGKFWEKEENNEKAIEIYRIGMEVAQKQNDKHAYGELATAKMSIDDEDF